MDYLIFLINQQVYISHYQQIINSGTSAWGSFQSLLGTIFLFPIKFFKEGVDGDCVNA